MSGRKWPEAEGAATLFHRFSAQIEDAVMSCSSGRELVGKGFGGDVEIASQVYASHTVPVLIDGCYSQTE